MGSSISRNNDYISFCPLHKVITYTMLSTQFFCKYLYSLCPCPVVKYCQNFFAALIQIKGHEV